MGFRGWTVYLALALSACAITPIDASRVPPADWPELAVEVRHTSRDPGTLCNLRGSPLQPFVGCAFVDFNARRCLIYLRVDSDSVLEHERMHCRGYDHPGESTFRAAWEAFKRSRSSAQVAGTPVLRGL